MGKRVQVIFKIGEKAKIQDLADRDGMSLSAWIREAALERARVGLAQARLSTRSQLVDFFSECDAQQDADVEPDWQTQKKVIEASRATGTSGT